MYDDTESVHAIAAKIIQTLRLRNHLNSFNFREVVDELVAGVGARPPQEAAAIYDEIKRVLEIQAANKLNSRWRRRVTIFAYPNYLGMSAKFWHREWTRSEAEVLWAALNEIVKSLSSSLGNPLEKAGHGSAKGISTHREKPSISKPESQRLGNSPWRVKRSAKGQYRYWYLRTWP